MENEVVVVGGLRTAFGKLGGSLKDMSVPELGSFGIKSLLERLNVPGENLDEVYFGVGILAGSHLSTARQIIFNAGIPVTTRSMLVDRACCSGLTAAGMAAKSIRAGEAQIAMSVGVECMSQTPLLLQGARWGHKLGDMKAEDILLMRAPFMNSYIAKYAGEMALKYGVSREEQDEWAFNSHQRYFAALDADKFEAEIKEMVLKDHKGNERVFKEDELPRRDTSLEKLSRLKTVYESPTVTPGNAPGLNDGTAALLFAAKTVVQQTGLTPQAKVLSHVWISEDPVGSVYIPGLAIKQAVVKAGISVRDLSLIEINEAFAAMPLVSTKILADNDAELVKKLRSITNVNGGAVAIGHPIGASGARILLTLINELRRRGGGYGAAAVCGGFGLSDAVVVRVD